MLTHVCLFWIDQPREQACDELLQASLRLLGKIPGPLALHCGRAHPSPRGVVDDSFSVGLTITFPNVEIMQRFREHPLHLEYVTDYVIRLSSRRVAYDIIQSPISTESPKQLTESSPLDRLVRSGIPDMPLN